MINYKDNWNAFYELIKSYINIKSLDKFFNI